MNQGANQTGSTLAGLLILGGAVLQGLAVVMSDQYGTKLIDLDVAPYFLGAFAAVGVFGIAGVMALTTRKLGVAASLALGAAIVTVGEWLAFGRVATGGFEIESTSRLVGIGVLACGIVIAGAIVGLAGSSSRAVSASQTVSASAVAAAGWYADPTGVGRMRWWDGSSWTDHVQS